VNLRGRFYVYYSLRLLAKSDRPIDRAILKYGFANFSLEILEFCDTEELLKREQHYLEILKPQYNILEIAGSILGYKHTEETLAKLRARRHSEETKAKMSTDRKGENHPLFGRSHSEDTKDKISKALSGENSPLFGKILSEETKRRMSEARLGVTSPRLGKKSSDETKQKISAASLGRKHSAEALAKISQKLNQKIEVLDLETGTKTTYSSMGEAARALDIAQSTITRYFTRNNPKPCKGRYLFTK
jgi:group I intron endonuclease